MQRRQFTASALALSPVLTALSPAAHAQGGPVEGAHYVRLQTKAPVSAPAGKIEVVEFFWYGCPHCNVFEPQLDAWQKKLPADVVFRRAPVAFRPNPFVLHQQIYFALEALGQVDAMHRKVFFAINAEHNKLDTPAAVGDFVAKNGLDKAKFLETMSSFGVQTKAKQAAQLSETYKIDGVPALGIQGQFYTSGQLAGSNENALRTADFLIARVRKGG